MTIIFDNLVLLVKEMIKSHSDVFENESNEQSIVRLKIDNFIYKKNDQNLEYEKSNYIWKNKKNLATDRWRIYAKVFNVFSSVKVFL